MKEFAELHEAGCDQSSDVNLAGADPFGDLSLTEFVEKPRWMISR